MIKFKFPRKTAPAPVAPPAKPVAYVVVRGASLVDVLKSDSALQAALARTDQLEPGDIIYTAIQSHVLSRPALSLTPLNDTSHVTSGNGQ